MQQKTFLKFVSCISAVLLSAVLVLPQVIAAKKPDFSKPLEASDVRIMKKVPLAAGASAGISGKIAPSPEGAATGILGTAPGEKFAVVFGVCDYPGVEDDICWQDGDSLNMKNALISDYGYLPENIYFFRDMDATFERFQDSVMSVIAQASPDDEVAVFFSGHGADGMAKDNDSEVRDEAIVLHDGFQKVFLWDGQLAEWFKDINTSRVIFIFDSCLAGGMNDVSAPGRVFVSAVGETQLAAVYSTGDPATGEPGEGLFSHWFVKEGILNGNADVYDYDQDGVLKEGNDVSVEEAFDYARQNASAARRTPTIEDNFLNDLLL